MILSTIKSYLYLGGALVIAGALAWGMWQKHEATKTQVLLEQQKAQTVLEKTRAERLNTALEASEKQRATAEKAINERDQRLAELNKQKEVSDAKLREALRANRAWADAPVPDSVRDAITGSGRQASPGAAPRKSH